MIERRKISELGLHITEDKGGRVLKFPVFSPALPSSWHTSTKYPLLDDSAISAPVADVGFYRILDCWVAGRGFLWVDDKALAEPDLMAAYVRDKLDAGLRDDAFRSSDRRIREIDYPVIMFTAEAHLIYGHWLLDYFPRVWLASRYFEMNGVTILLPHDTPIYAKEFVRKMFPDIRFEYWDWFAEDLHVRKLFVPSMLHNSHIFHPGMNNFVEDMIEAANSVVRHENYFEKVWVSRRLFTGGQSYRRALINEGAIVDLLQTKGFSIIFPEQMSWDEQVAVFSRAKVIVGEAGSGLHNALFSSRGAHVIAIRPTNHVQSSISLLRKQSINYLFPSEACDTSGVIEYEVDIAALRDLL